MASITINIEFDELVNSELDGVEAKVRKVILDNSTKLPGSITDVSEADRVEDDEEEVDD